MEDENLLDEETLVQETQDISPTSFTRNLVNWLGFSSQQHCHRTETVNTTNNNSINLTKMHQIKNKIRSCSFCLPCALHKDATYPSYYISFCPASAKNLVDDQLSSKTIIANQGVLFTYSILLFTY